MVEVCILIEKVKTVVNSVLVVEISVNYLYAFLRTSINNRTVCLKMRWSLDQVICARFAGCSRRP